MFLTNSKEGVKRKLIVFWLILAILVGWPNHFFLRDSLRFVRSGVTFGEHSSRDLKTTFYVTDKCFGMLT